MELTIRKATLDDLAEISKLNLELFNVQHKFDPTANLNWTMSPDGQEYFKTRISAEDSFTEVAEDKSGQLVGYIFGAIFKRQPWRVEGKYAELESIYIKPEHQVAGLGAKLTSDFINWCRQNKVNYISVIPTSKNEKAIKFYRKLGFSDYDLVMQLKLD
ncbi:MAG: GNAT family N-acetyltransferase [bacterium]|nr:GNAT family N-acetyltransferase [bacterium]